MNCQEAELHISALYDGEPVPPDAAQHISACESCRRVLNDYSRMGAELRLAAIIGPAQLPPLLPPRRNFFDFWWRRVPVPRLALAALIACLVLATTAVSLVHAQSKPLWFRFGYGFGKNVGSPYILAKAGYNQMGVATEWINENQIGVLLRVNVVSISTDDVVLRCRAVPAPTTPTAAGARVVPPKDGVPLDAAPIVHYKPGQALAIPVEGGSTVYLKGEVFDHEPKIAFGFPLDPGPGQFMIRSPVLISSNEILGDNQGITAIASKDYPVIRFLAGSHGTYLFALRPFPGAVQGKLEWGEITFKLDNEQYRLIAPAPMTGGDQPRPVWVSYNPEPVSGVGLGDAPLPE